ncbi:unnamed protein product, partial [Symbiodinium natans]
MLVLRLRLLWPPIWLLLHQVGSSSMPPCATSDQRYYDPLVAMPSSHEDTALDCQQRCAEDSNCQHFTFEGASLPKGACWLYGSSSAKLMAIDAVSGPKVCPEDTQLGDKAEAATSSSTAVPTLAPAVAPPITLEVAPSSTAAPTPAATSSTAAPTTAAASSTAAPTPAATSSTAAPTTAPAAAPAKSQEDHVSGHSDALMVGLDANGKDYVNGHSKAPMVGLDANGKDYVNGHSNAPTAEDAPEGGTVERCEDGLSTGCPVEWQTGPGGYYCYQTKGCRPVLDGPFPLEDCQDQCYIGEVEVPGGGDLAVPFDCYEDLEYVNLWSPMKRQWCCENSPVASIVCKEASSGAAECDDDVGTSCPSEWHTGPSGGYFCSSGPSQGGCSPASSGPFLLEDCQVQCCIGNCGGSDSKPEPPVPGIWDCKRHLDRWEWWPEEKKRFCCKHDDYAKKFCSHYDEEEESPGLPPRCSSEAAAKCPDSWLTGESGGYLCSGQNDPAYGGCRPAGDGPYPVEDCQEQCRIGHCAIGGHHPKPEFWDCERHLHRWAWWPEEKKIYCCESGKTHPSYCGDYIDRDHSWGSISRCGEDEGKDCPQSWHTGESGGYFCSSGQATGACREAADEPFPLEDCQEQCTIGHVSNGGGHRPMPGIWDCGRGLYHWMQWPEEKKIWCCAHSPRARAVCGHYAASHSSISCNADTAGGVKCDFPFLWQGEMHHSCFIESNKFGGEPWCVRVDGTWASCDCGQVPGSHTHINHVTHVHPGHWHHSGDGGPPYTCTDTETPWSNTKRQWCCAQTQCNATASEPFDCLADLTSWANDWSLQKKSWCWDSDEAVDEDLFDCDKGLANADRGWSTEKKNWCCRTKKKGCQQFFDCDLDLDNWETAWNSTKKKWCWDHEQKGGSAPYNCEDHLADYAEAWTPPKKEWCCANENLGCGETYDCETGFENWETEWTTPQKHFCCKTAQKACYDCAAGFANWERGWSAAKKKYCCQKEQKACHSCLAVNEMTSWSDEHRAYCCNAHNVACHDCSGDVHTFDAVKEAWCCANEGHCVNATTTTPTPCPDAGFDEDDPEYCNTPIGTWTTEKKDFCCKTFGRGCPGVHYDCDIDAHIWQYAWSLTKKAWCCLHHHVGCYPHYDCDTAVTSWSPEKQVWCCHHEKKGCELYDCYGSPTLWSKQHKDWCCRQHGQGCSELEPYHCQGGDGQNIYWSPEKKDWCCEHKKIGCSEPDFGGGHHHHHEQHEGCKKACHWDGQSHTCQDRIKYAASHRFQNQQHACTAAVHLVAGECDFCGECTVERSGCYVYWHKEDSHFSTHHVVTTVTHLGSSYHCHDGMDEMWAQEQKDFCCWKYRKGCPAPVVPAASYDCDAGFDQWETAWEAVRKEWCCKHRSRACQRFQCDLGLQNFQGLWGPPKKAWCCKHESKGCIAGFQWFDCTEKAERWETDWTPEKKGWCCSNKKMGCPGWHWHPGGVTHVTHTTYTTHHHSSGGRW